eukprot:396817_1
MGNSNSKTTFPIMGNSSTKTQLSNERLNLSNGFIFDKDKIVDVKSFESIILDEITYYKSIILYNTENVFDVEPGLLNAQLFSQNYFSRSTIPNIQFDAEKKAQFISKFMSKMITEYNKFMIALSKKFKNTTKFQKLNNFLDSLVPLPITVQICWRCHLLHPVKYYKDCMNHFGFILSPHTSNGNVITRNIVDAIKQIRPQIGLMILAPDKVKLDLQGIIRSKNYNKFKKSFSWSNTKTFTDLNFEITVMKQLEFMSKTSCKVWMTNFQQHLKSFASRYIMYLQTGASLTGKKDINCEFDSLSPTFNIDLIWHTHMMYPYLYRKDCINITNGMMLDHDDISVGDKVDVINEKDSCQNKSDYWTYGRLGQFDTSHFVSIILKPRYELIVMGYIRQNIEENVNIPTVIIGVVKDLYFNDVSILTDIGPQAPKVKQDKARCKYGPACCVGDHINFIKGKKEENNGLFSVPGGGYGGGLLNYQ